MVMSICSWAQGHENTTDHLTISGITLNPGAPVGDNDCITISLEGSRRYATFGADIYLPAGYEWAKDSYGETAYLSIDGTMFSVGRGGVITTHAVGYNMQEDGALRITVAPTGTGDMSFKANSGALIDVYVKATSYAKPGPAAIQIKHCYFSTEAGVQYDTKDITIDDKVSASASSSLPFSISSSAHWSTCILPFNAEVPAGVVAYTCSKKNEENLLLTEATALDAYTPYILYSESGCSSTLNGTVDPAAYPADGFVKSGYLCGAIEPQVVNDGYVLQNLSEGVKFYSCNGADFNIPAGKCWVEIDEASAKNGYGFIIEGQQTPISNVITENNDNACYTLSGLRVNAPTASGIYIVNNKKVIINK